MSVYRVHITITDIETGDIAYDCVGFEYEAENTVDAIEKMLADMRIDFDKNEFSITLHNVHKLPEFPF